MNSWMSTLLSACAPPLMMFIIGTGSVRSPLGARCRYKGNPWSVAAACAAANDTAKIALAPRFRFAVGAVQLDHLRIERGLVLGFGAHARAARIGPLTLPTALSTPLPP